MKVKKKSWPKIIEYEYDENNMREPKRKMCKFNFHVLYWIL